jgi:hypothetical protein
MAPFATDLLLIAAGALAGVLGTAGAITSLVSYPALLAAGLSPLAANIGNLVALVACWPGSALTSRRDLVGAAPWLRRTLPVAAVGTAAGAVLLITTPSGVFDELVPVLVALGAVALLAQPWLTARHARSAPRTHVPALVVVGLISVYGGYFGAGGGVMLLAAALVFIDASLPRANAIKNMLVGAGALTAAVVLVVARPVPWAFVGPLALGLFVGSLFGPVVARRLPAPLVRIAVAALGLGLAVGLWLR